jgi:hypothetical protein
LTNLTEKDHYDEGLGGFKRCQVMEFGGKKIGFLGIIEKDWTIALKNKLECEPEY